MKILTITITNLLADLVADLAAESHETPEDLLTRLIQKEHFDRHAAYDALRGTCQAKPCTSSACFMRKSEAGV